MARRSPARLVAGLGVLAVLAAVAGSASGSTPPSSPTVAPSPSAGQDVTVTWTGLIPGGANSDNNCTASANDALNDHHTLSLAVPTGFYGSHVARATFSITLDAPAVDDVVLSVVLPGGTAISADNNSLGVGESVLVPNPGAGRYDAVACAFAGGPQPYTGKLVLHTLSPAEIPVKGGTAPGVTPPTFANHVAPGALANDAGEPSIGVNWKSGAVFLQAVFETAKILFDPAGKPTWTNVSSPETSITSLDPILASDDANGRVFVSQLTGLDSLSAFTDDDGRTYTPSQGGGIPSGPDHQSIGSGPYPTGGTAKALTAFPNAVYYCSQAFVAAFCARSDTGGLVFGPGIPIYTSQCGGLHGHVRVAPDGTVYVPNKNCGGRQGLAVSTDAGMTWTVRTLPLSNAGDSDPSVAAGKDNTAYFGYANGDGKAEISVTRDRGVTFSKPVDVGAALGVQNAAFPEVIAGDGDRAAFAFLGTTTAGSAQDPNFGKDKARTSYIGAEYHLYIATTFDRGVHWTTVDATGSDPVQRGRICLGGTGCSGKDRNLLDFMDIQVDKQGRVLVGWPDGCTTTCVTSRLVAKNTFSAKGVVTRQTGGPLLFATSAAITTPSAGPPPAQQPTAAGPAARGSGGALAATGLSVALPVIGLALLVGVAVLRRRRG